MEIGSQFLDSAMGKGTPPVPALLIPVRCSDTGGWRIPMAEALTRSPAHGLRLRSLLP